MSIDDTRLAVESLFAELTDLRARLAAVERERDELRNALIRWHSAEGTEGFPDADQALFYLAAQQSARQ